MNNDQWPAFMIGMIIGALVTFGLISFPTSYHSQAIKALNQCEKDLPRSQECIIFAIPESEYNVKNK